MFDAKGMKTYNNIVMSMRIAGIPIGPQYYRFDRQFKQWCKGKSIEEVMSPAEKSKFEKQKAREARQNTKRSNSKGMDGTIKRNLSKEEIQELVERVKKETASSGVVMSGEVKSTTSLDAAVKKNKTKGKTVESAQEERDKALREKVKQLEMKKLADSLKCDDRLGHIKSVGNGL